MLGKFAFWAIVFSFLLNVGWLIGLNPIHTPTLVATLSLGVLCILYGYPYIVGHFSQLTWWGLTTTLACSVITIKLVEFLRPELLSVSKFPVIVIGFIAISPQIAKIMAKLVGARVIMEVWLFYDRESLECRNILKGELYEIAYSFVDLDTAIASSPLNMVCGYRNRFTHEWVSYERALRLFGA